MKKKIKFEIPIIENGKKIDDLHVSATITLNKKGEMINHNIDKVVWFDTGNVGTHIHRLLKIVAPDYFKILTNEIANHLQ